MKQSLNRQATKPKSGEALGRGCRIFSPHVSVQSRSPWGRRDGVPARAHGYRVGLCGSRRRRHRPTLSAIAPCSGRRRRAAMCVDGGVPSPCSRLVSRAGCRRAVPSAPRAASRPLPLLARPLQSGRRRVPSTLPLPLGELLGLPLVSGRPFTKTRQDPWLGDNEGL